MKEIDLYYAEKTNSDKRLEEFGKQSFIFFLVLFIFIVVALSVLTYIYKDSLPIYLLF